MIKNIFFIFILISVGILNSLLGTVSAKPQTQLPEAMGNLGKIALMPNAVSVPEKLHRYANLSYKVKGVRYYPKDTIQPFSQTGLASWYGEDFHGRLTTSGERYDMYEMTAAHKTLPIPSYVKVTNLKNHRTIIVRVNDRGPFHSNRIIDLSYAAAKKLGFVNNGVAQVRVDQIVPKSKLQQLKQPELEYATLREFNNLPDAQAFMQKVNNLINQSKTAHSTVSLVANNQGYSVQVGSQHNSQKELEAIKQLITNANIG